MADLSPLQHVMLGDRHEALGGRMVPFAGYALPVHYPSGILAEHRWTREHASLFDVSHMGPCLVELADSAVADRHAAIAGLIEPLVSGDIAGLKPGHIRYTLLLAEDGGTLDDLMVARPHDAARDGLLYLVVNAGTKQADFALLTATLGDEVRFTRLDDGALLALQGPEAAAVLAGLLPGAVELGFMRAGRFDWGGTPLTVSRSGYTGEDGFEIQIDAAHAPALWEALLADPRVRPAGLGARDSLRLEAGLPLYGHDLDATISPVEAGLTFAVSKRRRDAGDLRGADRIRLECAGTLSRRRVGLLVEGAPAREGAPILDIDGTTIGIVTSGGFSPTLNRAIAMGYVPPEFAGPGTDLRVAVRGREQPARIVPLPFVPHRYVRPSSKP